MSSDEGSVGSNEVSEVMSPQVSLETTGPQRVTDLPRYHSLVEDFGRLADRCQEHGNFRTFSLLFFMILYVDLPPPFFFFSQFHSSRKDNTRAIDPKT